MKAVVKAKPSPGVEIRDVALPVPQPGEVLIRVDAVGICGSDLHIYEWTPGYDFLIPHFPLTLGHEFAGEIVDSRSNSFRVGEKVTSETGRICGKCFFCRQGKGVLCSLRTSFGRIGLERNGAMAEFVTVHEDCLHRIPPGVSPEEAAVTEPAAVALGAVELARFYPDDVVVILGPGPIGLLILQMAKALGAARVVIFGQEADRPRLEVARKLGADLTLTGESPQAVPQLLELTQGLGAGVVFEASGSPAAAASGLKMLRKAGEMILVEIYPEPIPVDATHQMVRQMKTIRGSYGGAPLDWDRVLGLMAGGKLHVGPLITSILPLERAPEGFETVLQKKALKILLRPDR